jgi:hypothetical protein
MLAWSSGGANSLETFERGAAGRRDAAAVGHQTMRDALAVRNELSADHHGVVHAGIVIVLGVRGQGRELRRKAKDGEGDCTTKLHGPFPISGK